MNIAVFCSDAADTYQLAVITALSREAASQGHRTAVFVTNVLPEAPEETIVENQFLQLPGAGIFDGSVVLTDSVLHRAPPDIVRRHLAPLDHSNWVSIGRFGGPQTTLTIENTRAFRTLLEHLLTDHGYRDFLFLLGPEASADARDRSEAIQRFLNDKGPSVKSSLMVADFRGDRAHERVLEHFRQGLEPPPRVIVACNDGMALGALAALRELGLRCPEDVAVIGFDDVEVAALEYPSLTTIRQPLKTLSAHALTALRAQGEGKPFSVRSETVVPTEVVYRESCGCRPADLTPEDYRRQLSRIQSLRAQEAALLHQGSAFSLEINAALDLGSLLEGLDRFCRALSAGALSVALFHPEDQTADSWPRSLTVVYRHDGRTGGPCRSTSSLGSIVFQDHLPPNQEQLPLVFLLHNRGRRIGLLSCAFPASWTGFFKLMAANLSTGLSRVDLLGQIQAHSQALETAVDQRTKELTKAVGALRQEIDRRRALERELGREQEALQTILDTQPLPLAILSKADGGIRYYNRPFAQLAGFEGAGDPPSPEELTRIYGPILSWSDEAGWDGPYRELRLPGVSGGFLRVMAQRSELNLRGEACLIVGMMDLTRQKQLEQDLLTISENERERFGQELHDDVCQQLAALSLYTTILGQKIETRLGERLEEVEELSELIDGILDHVRGLSRGLFPIEVGDQSLDRVFGQFLVRIEVQTKLTCRLVSNLDGRSTGLAPADELHLYRILQEAVQNTLKYAKASSIFVRLTRNGQRLRLRYEDDGVGMTAEAREGVGLRSMRYRASQLGARLTVGRAPGTGVTLDLDLLLSEKGRLP